MGQRRSGVGITGLSSSATTLACSASISRLVAADDYLPIHDDHWPPPMRSESSLCSSNRVSSVFFLTWLRAGSGPLIHALHCYSALPAECRHRRLRRVIRVQGVSDDGGGGPGASGDIWD